MSDTIAAIATGDAISAIGIIRVSGSDCIRVGDLVFRSFTGVSLADTKDRIMLYGMLQDSDNTVLDLCLCMISRSPNSYTGEDTMEFHCHGSPTVLREVLELLFRHGIRQAEAGEFTKRAFLNNRMDLTQAEAVIDLIEAQTPIAAKNAAAQLQGAIGTKLESLYSELLNIIAHFHVKIDYPDELIDEFDLENYTELLDNTYNELSKMLATHARGKVMLDGLPTAIIGRPNTGKSSLLNALLGYERAIVTDIPGTTRDTIEERLLIDDMLLRITDTAGIRISDDVIESLGVARTFDAVMRSSLAIIVFDGSQSLCDDDYEVINSIPEDVAKIIVVNKSDLPQVLNDDELDKLGISYCRLCAISGAGLVDLEELIKTAYPKNIAASIAPGEIITNARQAQGISKAMNYIKSAISAMEAFITADAVLLDVEEALAEIGEITGKTMREDIIDRIFQRFCVGK
ncbi:MAG: tRNA uridine-5-carboxymethylaminomethyl(34) synthesis GTPase MnmE [Oscillospiraceae bacterium]|nr:tRNA uridine-5-carboxymethylaminomethyl(34) synthesis GTPase MnmE [Oscillospiraceae bacterium]